MTVTEDRLGEIQGKLEKLTQSVTPRNAVERVVDIALKVLLVIAPAVGGVIYGHANRITTLEESTVRAKEFQAQMAKVNEQIMHAQNGPQWLRESLAAVNAKLDVQRDMTSQLAERLARVEAHSEIRGK